MSSLAGLKGYAADNSTLLLDTLLEPVFAINQRWALIPALAVYSNTENLSDQFSVDLTPAIDWVVADGNLISVGFAFGVTGPTKAKKTAISISLLRSM